MYELTATLSRKKRILKLCATDTIDDLYQQICKHTDAPEKIHILSIKKITGSKITIIAESAARISALICEVTGCGNEIKRGATFYTASIEDDMGPHNLCVCKHCRARIIRDEQKRAEAD